MIVNFYSRKENAGRTAIYCFCSFDGYRISFSTKLSVPARKWNAKKQRATGMSEVNDRLDEIEERCYDVYNSLSKTGAVDAQLFKRRAMDSAFSKRGATRFVIPYYEEWASEIRVDKKPNRQNKLACNVFKKYAAPNITFDEITKAWIDKFLLHLQNCGYSLNYIGVHLKNLKAVMNAAYKDGLHDNLAFRQFKKMEEDADAVYLTDAEIAKIENVAGLSERQEKARDLFLVGYYTAMRFSDYSRLSMNDIRDGIIRFLTKKTHEEVLIPANPKLIAILEKYGGRAPSLSEQHLNYFIKDVCRDAGVDDFVTRNITKGGEVVQVWKPKYEFVTSHTARRSGATNMYKSGIKTRYIMMITGHQSEATFRRYIRISKAENAENLSSNKFFKG